MSLTRQVRVRWQAACDECMCRAALRLDAQSLVDARRELRRYDWFSKYFTGHGDKVWCPVHKPKR